MKGKDILQMFPELCFDAYAKTDKLKEIKALKKGIIVCGMGGSAISGFLLQDLLQETPVFVNNHEHLPDYSKKFYNIFISYSGNTQETLDCYKKAKKLKSKCFVITSGGKMKKDANYLLPEGMQPRFSLPYILMPLLKITGQIDEKKSWELFSFLKNNQKEIKAKAEEIAQNIEIPILYVPFEYKGVGYRFQTQVNENAKFFAHYHYMPEMRHNEINALFPKDTQVILATEKYLEKTNEFLKKEMNKRKVLVYEIPLKGENQIQKMFYLLYLTDYISYFFGVKRKVEIDKVETIERLKKHLSK